MPVLMHEQKYAYFPVPKCACTSLKHFFFEIENGFRFKSFKVNGRPRYIHNAAYPSNEFNAYMQDATKDMHCVAVVRDPISRVLSCYANRVLHHRELDNVELSDKDIERGMTQRPTLDLFLRFFRRYRELSGPIAHHSRSLSYFLGKDSSFFHRIYDISQVGQMIEDMKVWFRSVPELRRMQKSGLKLTAADLSPKQIAKVKNLFAEDYEVFGDFFKHTDINEPRLARI